MPSNWEARDKKLDKRKHGHQTSGRSVFIVQESQRKRDRKLIERGRDIKRAEAWQE